MKKHLKNKTCQCSYESFSCSICNGNDFNVLWTIGSNADGLLEEDYQLLICDNCTSGHTFPLPESTVISKYYGQGVYKHSGGRASKPINSILSFLSDVRLREINNVVGTRRGLLLDIGCGKGRFLARAAQQNWQVRGTDVAQSQVSAAFNRYNLDIFHGEVMAAEFPDNTFDIVTAWHVLEHLYNPHEVVQEVHRILKSGGIFVFEVPNLASWQANIGRGNWFQLDVPRHLNHYTITSMTNLIEQHGFQVKTVHTFAIELGFFGMLQSMINRLGLLPPNSLFQWLKKSRQFSLSIVLANILLVIIMLIPAIVLELIAKLKKSGGVIRLVVVKE